MFRVLLQDHLPKVFATSRSAQAPLGQGPQWARGGLNIGVCGDKWGADGRAGAEAGGRGGQQDGCWQRWGQWNEGPRGILALLEIIL